MLTLEVAHPLTQLAQRRRQAMVGGPLALASVSIDALQLGQERAVDALLIACLRTREGKDGAPDEATEAARGRWRIDAGVDTATEVSVHLAHGQKVPQRLGEDRVELPSAIGARTVQVEDPHVELVHEQAEYV